MRGDEVAEGLRRGARREAVLPDQLAYVDDTAMHEEIDLVLADHTPADRRRGEQPRLDDRRRDAPRPADRLRQCQYAGTGHVVRAGMLLQHRPGEDLQGVVDVDE